MIIVSDKLYIGFGYKARHGKNFCADAIHRAFPSETRILGFADALKAHCRVAFGMRKKDGPLLQTVGTDLYRRTNSELWVEVLEATASDFDEPIVLIPDVRFPNEAEFIKSRGGSMIKVSRLNGNGTPFVAQDRPADHPSETALDSYEDWDGQIIAGTGHVERLKGLALYHFSMARKRWEDRQENLLGPVDELGTKTPPPLVKAVPAVHVYQAEAREGAPGAFIIPDAQKMRR